MANNREARGIVMNEAFNPLKNIRYSIIETRGSNRGFTLIELIIFIVIAGIFVPLAYVAFSTALKSGTNPENIITARFLAEKKMEELTNSLNDFIERQNIYPASVNTSYSNIPNYSGYQWKWTISYITYSGRPPVISDSASPTNYLKIIVYVKEPQGFEYTVHTILTKRPGAS